MQEIHTAKSRPNGEKRATKVDGFCIMAAVYVALIVMMIIPLLSPKTKYVVTYKANNKIEYKSLRDGTTHVLDFDDKGMQSRSYAERLQYYKYINPGDTISGDAVLRDKTMPAAWGVVPRLGYTPTVYRVNGNSLHKWIEMQQRDSVIRTMHQKQK